MATRTVAPSSTAYVVMYDTRTPVGVAQLVHSIWTGRGKAATQEREINNDAAKYPDMVAWTEPYRVHGGRLVAVSYQRGSARHSSKLTEDTVAEARERHREGESTRRLALAYGVSVQAMSNALNGRSWRHVA